MEADYMENPLGNNLEKPSPGSPDAIKLGCTCPILDNYGGRGLGKGMFWINKVCPIHGTPTHEV
ncbi:MAG: hypothetical protein WC444_07640 [Candidatus Paceibacterota bacterium]